MTGSHSGLCSMARFATLLLLQVFTLVRSQLVRDRNVQCLSNEMRVSIEFSQPFSGVIYASKFYTTAECRWEGNGSRNLAASIPLSVNPATKPYCGTQVKGDTGEFAVTLIISPMRGLLVDGMEGLTVRCLYTVQDVTLTLPAGANGAGIFVSPQTQAGVVTGSGGSPFLKMAIKDGHGINGDNIQSAQVGQRITLDVIMEDTAIYDFWVHDCYAHDGTNTPEASISIVDANGCAVRLARAVDPPVFTTQPVANGAKHVYVHMYGFQFTTSQLVYFECQVRPCLQTCNRPQCTESGTVGKSRRRRQTNTLSGTLRPGSSDNYNLTAVIRIEPQPLEALIPAARDSPIVDRSAISADAGSQICMDHTVAVVVLVIFVFVCVVSLFISIYMCHRARREQKVGTGGGSSMTAAAFYTPASTPISQQLSSTPSPRPTFGGNGGMLSGHCVRRTDASARL